MRTPVAEAAGVLSFLSSTRFADRTLCARVDPV